MFLRSIAILGVVAVLIIAYVAWTRNTQNPAPAGNESGAAQEAPSTGGVTPPGGGAEPPVVEGASDPGLAWTVPPQWTDQGATSMRLATYVIHGANDTEAQCAVYYFGPGQGGTVDANLERWQGEFKDADPALRSKIKTNDIEVTRIDLNGTYMAHVGMMGAGSSTEMPKWALIGAIAEGPKGSVFFKLTGPEAIVKKASADFERMLKSIHKV